MSLSLATRAFPEDTPFETAVRRTHDLGLRSLALTLPGPVEPGTRDALRAGGLDCAAVVHADADGATGGSFARGAGLVLQAAATLRAQHAVFEGGRLEDPEMREATHEARTLEALRALHRASADGAPIAIRPGGTAADLLLLEETAWVLDDLPQLTLFLDPARALGLQRLGLGPDPKDWADRFARRVAGVFVHGLGSGGKGGSHPEDDAPSWREIRDIVPRAAPWVLDLAPGLAAADIEDAIRYIELES